MPLKINSKFRSHTRRLFATALLAAFALAVLFVTNGGPSAHAQRKGKQTANDNAAAPKTGPTKRVFVGGSSSTPRGSRVTIKSDNPLNDYSAYRSGDRFYVVVPGANAGSVAKGASGRGFSDMQVQQRGKDVVLSYKVQPGAKPKVEQKFNRLNVVFEAAEGTTPAQADNARNTKTPANANQNPVVNSTSSNQTSTPAQNQSVAERNAGRPNAAETNSSQSGSTSSPTGASVPPAGVVESSMPSALPPLAEQTPASTPAAEQQLAQAQPPTTVAPITTTTTTTQPSAATGTSIGAVVLRNWPLALTLALLVVGVGLFFAARRSSAERGPESETAETGATLKAARPAKLKDASSTLSKVETKRAAETSTLAAVAPVVSKPAAAASDSSGAKRKKEDKKKRGKERAVEEKTVAAQETGAVASAETQISSTETTAAVASTETVAQEAALASSIAALSTSVASSDEAAPVAKESAAIDAKGIEPAVSLDGDVVQVEMKRMLDGEPSDVRVVGTSDVLARQMIAAELLAALAGRNTERRERARAAFVAHGYLDDAAKDLGGASAPAERASAARSVGLVGDPSSTPLLVAALEDSAVEVRRAAVEALASLRDPSAVEPLEELLEREKKSKTKVNRKLVQHAIDTCREGFAEPPAVVAPAVEVAAAPVVESAAASVAEITTEVESVPVNEAASEVVPFVEETTHAVEEAAPVEELAQSPATETAPELLVTEDASVETVAPETEVEEVAAAETAVEEAEAAVESPMVEEPAVEETTALESAETFEPAQPAPVYEPVMLGESPIKDFELWDDEEETPTVEATTPPVAEEAAPFAEPQAFEDAPRAVEVEEFTLTPPAHEVAPALEDESLASVSEVKGIEALRDTGPSLPFAEAVEEGEKGLAPAQDAEATEWVELDMSESETAAPSAPVFETSGGDALSETFASSAPSETETRLEEYAPVTEASITPREAEASIAPHEVETGFADEHFDAPPAAPSATISGEEKSVELFDEFSTVPASIQQRLASGEAGERADAILELSRLDTSEAFHQICAAFDDDAREVRSAAARALFNLRDDRAESFTRALRESDADRRRNIGTSISASGLASEAISQLTGESREKTYEAFSLLFLMAKAGEVQPLIRAIEGHPNNEVRLAVVKLLALSGQKEVLPAFRRLAVRGSLPTEVRSAVMEAIYQISSSGQPDPTHAA